MSDNETVGPVDPKLPGKIGEYAKATRDLKATSEAIAKLAEAANKVFAATNASLLNRETELEEAVNKITEEIHTLTIEAYRISHNKHPAPGVGIRIYQDVEYDLVEALKYCQRVGKFLVVDRKKFDKYVKLHLDEKLNLLPAEIKARLKTTITPTISHTYIENLNKEVNHEDQEVS